jgi:aubergine-like protein
MLMGIDVCHSGPNSIVGFCASINKDKSQYWSERIVQRKGQEIVGAQLKDCIKRALGCFEAKNNGVLPEHFIIYRDGVGDAMRRQVLLNEVTQLREAIGDTYNKVKNKPFITVIIVNKRITQRFFVEDEQGRLMNPPSGALIDAHIVENEDLHSEYDFYVVPLQTTQGCVLPTHYFVAYNDSPIDKRVIQKFTFDLCHYYFNWAGPIKVPAPCMYAHKIAELFENLGKEARQLALSERICQSYHYL